MSSPWRCTKWKTDLMPLQNLGSSSPSLQEAHRSRGSEDHRHRGSAYGIVSLRQYRFTGGLR